MAKIIPIKDLKDTSALSAKVNASDEPIFITKNGYGDMVIMSMKVFEKLGKGEDIEKKPASQDPAFTGAIV